MPEFFAMGGYAMYVWPAYAVFLIVLAWDWIAPAFRRRHLLGELRGRMAREQLRRARSAPTQGSREGASA